MAPRFHILLLRCGVSRSRVILGASAALQIVVEVVIMERGDNLIRDVVAVQAVRERRGRMAVRVAGIGVDSDASGALGPLEPRQTVGRQLSQTGVPKSACAASADSIPPAMPMWPSSGIGNSRTSTSFTPPSIFLAGGEISFEPVKRRQERLHRFASAQRRRIWRNTDHLPARATCLS